jgi:endonuclease YncB( thermonuclease family)
MIHRFLSVLSVLFSLFILPLSSFSQDRPALELRFDVAARGCELYVKRVSDGDTFHADTYTTITYGALKEDTGFRLARVRAPERGEAGYAEAKALLTKLIDKKPVAVLVIHPGSNMDVWREKYGRFFVEVFRCEPSSLQPPASRLINVNDEMRAAGWTDKGRGIPPPSGLKVEPK